VGKDLNNAVRSVHKGLGFGVNSARVEMGSTLDENQIAYVEGHVSDPCEIEALLRMERIELERLVSCVPYDLAFTKAGSNELGELSRERYVADKEGVKPEARGPQVVQEEGGVLRNSVSGGIEGKDQ
jgi:hypothetical protein